MTLADGRIVTERGVLRGSLEMRGGVIERIAEGGPRPEGAVDCAGKYLLPGLFDSHMHAVDLVEVINGLEPRFSQLGDAANRGRARTNLGRLLLRTGRYPFLFLLAHSTSR